LYYEKILEIFQALPVDVLGSKLKQSRSTERDYDTEGAVGVMRK